MSAPDTALYVEALTANSPKSGEYVETNRGRYGGTWAHPKLAVFFARWLDVRFSVWCDAAQGRPCRWASGLSARESAVAPSGQVGGKV